MSTRILSKISFYVRFTCWYLRKRPAAVVSLGGIIVTMVTLVIIGYSLESLPFLLLWGLSPLLVTAVYGMSCQGRIPQVILMVAALAYLAWFSWIIQQEFGLVIVSPFSLPILIPLWVAASIIDRRTKKQANKSE